jgi:hypothetical protein
MMMEMSSQWGLTDWGMLSGVAIFIHLQHINTYHTCRLYMTREIHNNRGARAGSGDTSTVPLKAMHVFVTAVERKHTLHFAHLLHASRIRHHDSRLDAWMEFTLTLLT